MTHLTHFFNSHAPFMHPCTSVHIHTPLYRHHCAHISMRVPSFIAHTFIHTPSCTYAHTHPSLYAHLHHTHTLYFLTHTLTWASSWIHLREYKRIKNDSSNSCNKFIPLPVDHPYSLRTIRNHAHIASSIERHKKSFIPRAASLIL